MLKLCIFRTVHSWTQIKICRTKDRISKFIFRNSSFCTQGPLWQLSAQVLSWLEFQRSPSSWNSSQISTCVSIFCRNKELSWLFINRFSANRYMKVKRMGITEILRRIWLFSANKIKSSESVSKQPSQLIFELNSSLRQKLDTL